MLMRQLDYSLLYDDKVEQAWNTPVSQTRYLPSYVLDEKT